MQLVQRCQDHRAISDTTSNLLFVGGLALEATEDHLFRHFSKFGVVTSARIQRRASGKSKGFAYLQILCSACADRAVTESPQVILGSVITVQRALSLEQKKSLQASRMTRKLFVSRIPTDFQASDLVALFSRFGSVESVTQVKAKPPTTTKSCLIIMKDVEIATSIRNLKRIAIPNKPPLFVKPLTSSGAPENNDTAIGAPSRQNPTTLHAFSNLPKKLKTHLLTEDSRINYLPRVMATRSGCSTDGEARPELFFRERAPLEGCRTAPNAARFVKLRPCLQIACRTDAEDSVRGTIRDHVFLFKTGQRGHIRSAGSVITSNEQPESNLVFNIGRL